MIQTVKIDTFDDLEKLLFEQERNKENGRYRSSFFYRGQPSEDFDLSTSLLRNCGELANVLEQPLSRNLVIDENCRKQNNAIMKLPVLQKMRF